jgi:GntR family transcriptional regulator
MKYYIIDRLIRETISGTIQKGEQLPSENQLSQRYQVPRIHVRDALKVLEEMGYIFSKQGKGRFLRARQERIPLNLNGNESFSRKMAAAGLDLRTSVTPPEIVAYDRKIYCNLQAEPDEGVYRLERLRTIHGTPVAIHSSFIKASMFPHLDADWESIESLFSYFQSHGYTAFGSTRNQLQVILPTAGERLTLSCPPLVPLLLVESDTIDRDTGAVLQFTKILYRSDSFQYEI